MSDPMHAAQPVATTPPAQGLPRPAPREPEQLLHGSTRLWLRRLPAGRRPLRLCALHPQVANRLAFCWADPAIREQTLDDLLNDRRGGREGLSTVVVRELQRLRERDAPSPPSSPELPGPPWWRAMVKAGRN